MFRPGGLLARVFAWAVASSACVALVVCATHWGGATDSVAAKMALLAAGPWTLCCVLLVSACLASIQRLNKVWQVPIMLGACFAASSGVVLLLIMLIDLSGPGVITAANDSLAMSAFAKMENGIGAAVFCTPLVCFWRSVSRVGSISCAAIGLFYAAFFAALP